METASTVSVLRARVGFWRRGDHRLALVPTMGNLHEGHLCLVRRARELADRVVVSCFVNPLQFGPREDFAAYPRTPEQDHQALAALGVDLLFTPSVEEMYPRGMEQCTRVEVPGLSADFCGASRPGHFIGVCTLVAKLFHMVQPDVALFGRKDYQQLIIIRRMAEDLDWPLEIESVDTVREPDGLALSSRNRYLSTRERAVAPRLYEVLKHAAEQIRAGDRDFAGLERSAMESLAAAGFEPEYLRVVRASDLSDPDGAPSPLVILAAARLGRARLIDNVAV